jgi:hypothetical protein
MRTRKDKPKPLIDLARNNIKQNGSKHAFSRDSPKAIQKRVAESFKYGNMLLKTPLTFKQTARPFAFFGSMHKPLRIRRLIFTLYATPSCRRSGFGSKSVASSDCPDEVVADDF